MKQQFGFAKNLKSQNLTLENISKLEIKCFENALSKIDKEKNYEQSLSIMSG